MTKLSDIVDVNISLTTVSVVDGQRVKAVREALELSVKNAADVLALGPHNYRRLEDDYFSGKQLDRILPLFRERFSEMFDTVAPDTFKEIEGALGLNSEEHCATLPSGPSREQLESEFEDWLNTPSLTSEQGRRAARAIARVNRSIAMERFGLWLWWDQVTRVDETNFRELSVDFFKSAERIEVAPQEYIDELYPLPPEPAETYDFVKRLDDKYGPNYVRRALR